MAQAVRGSLALAGASSAFGCVAEAVGTAGGAALPPQRGPQKQVNQLDPDVIARFARSLKGRAIRPGDGDYEAARQVWNAIFDKRPGLIVACADRDDVARTIEFSRRENLLTSVRSGGHSLAGKSTCDGGVVLDLSRLKHIEIDPVRRIARAEAGLLLGEFDAATAAQGLATTTGTEPSTGITGLTLGGGLGWLMGKYGLACDNLRSVEMVLADGRMITASASINDDMFWAVRGAGANFGVVTSLEYDLHPVGTILAGVIKYPPEMLREVLTHYRAFTQTMPDDVGLSIGTIPTPEGKSMASIAVSHCGDLAAAEQALRPLRALTPVLSDDIGPVSYLEFQQRGAMPEGLRLKSLTRSSFLKDLSDSAIEAIVEYAAVAPAMAGNFVIERVHGRACRTEATATAFPHRGAGHNFSIHGMWLDASGEEPSTAWSTSFWQAMQPFVSTAVYSNYLADEGTERARAAYGVNYERLALLKNKYDPSNFFNSNQNIAPAS